MTEIAISDEYKRSFNRLTETERFRVSQLMNEIQYDCVSNGSRPEQLQCLDGKVLKSYRVNDDLRLILYKWRKDGWLAITCGHHDETYNRVKKMRLSAQKEAELPVVKIVVEERKIVEYKPASLTQESHRLPKPVLKTYAFGQMPDDSLLKIGVPQSDLVRLRSATSDDDILGIIEEYESAIQERVLALVDNPLCLRSMLESISNEKPRRSISQIIKTNAADRANYFILTPDLQTKFFAGQIENWQVLLHPSQQDSVTMEANGPAMVTGAAGTGKTVVAVHRAKWLLENRFRNGERILFTTYVTTLVDSVKSMLRAICTPEQLSRIDVITLDSILRKEWGRFRSGGRIVYGDDKLTLSMLDNLLAEDSSLYSGRRTNEFLAKEYEKVILEFDIHSLGEYRKVERSGILGRVDREKERAVLWPVFAALSKMSLVDTAGDINRAAALNQLANAMSKGDHAPLNRYVSVIVDEAQDFGAPEYRFLAALTGNRYDNPVPYSLFICGDGHQRVYGRSGSLKECGINVHSRSRTLKVCYRSTQMIREYAENILSGVETKDMNGDSERLTDVSSLEKGVAPEEKFFQNGDYTAMSKFMSDALRSLHESGVRYSDMAVLLRNAGRLKGDDLYLKGAAHSLQESGIPAVVVSKKSPALHADAVQIMTMHRSKGLQFHGVIVDLTHWPYREKNALDDEQRKSILDQEKQLLYIAVMRATSRVFITGAKGRPWELPKRQITVANETVADGATPPKCETVLPIKPDASLAKPNNASIYHDFKRWLHANGEDAAKKALLSYEQDAIRLYNAKKDKDKATEIIAQYSCSQNEKLLAPWWAQFCKQNSCSKKLIEVIHEGLSEVGECFMPTCVDGVKSQKRIPLPVQFTHCPICGMKIKSSRLQWHIKRMHATRKEYHAHLTNAPDPEDVQRELYGDW